MTGLPVLSGYPGQWTGTKTASCERPAPVSHTTGCTAPHSTTWTLLANWFVLLSLISTPSLTDKITSGIHHLTYKYVIIERMYFILFKKIYYIFIN